MTLRRVWGVGAGLAVVGGIAIGARLHRGWGATADERAAPLPGDDLIANPVFESTRAITIQAAPDSVWPWLVQMGMGRGGWYSYDSWAALISSVPTASASRIIPKFQNLRLGDAVELGDRMVFQVKDLRPNRALVLHADEHQVPLQPWIKTWAFVLEPLEGGATRLLVRERSSWTRRWVGAATAVTGWIWFWATRRQLKNLKALVEAT
ncbi:MAG: hypothetical protein LBD77_04330 [Bifidobacteriaceae bacterium]|jgi:hypothetical protein|nr:hypothetical protein [Bifidobacteriaceae bacterium]